MKNQIRVAVLVFSCVAALFFGVFTGRQFLVMVSGPVPAAELALEELEGKYITYDVAYPVVSFVEKYYSGNQNRASKIAYITYDEKRQAFLKIVVPDRKNTNFESLMRAVNRSEELKASWGDMQASQERPIQVKGSLTAITDSEKIQQIEAALMGPDWESDEEMNFLALAQTDWYVIEDGHIGGFPAVNLWGCAFTVAVNLLIFLIFLVFPAKKGGAAATPGGLGGSVEIFFAQQKGWLEQWCQEARGKRNQMAVLFMAGFVAVLVGIGFLAKYSVLHVLTLHLPIGVIIGEIAGLLLFLGGKMAFNPQKILSAYQRKLERDIPAREEREALAEELLGTESSWSLLEKGKEECIRGIVGERYWMVLLGNGNLTVVDSERVETIKSEVESGQIRSGKVRVNYTYYVILMNYYNSTRKKGNDVRIVFNTEDASGHFMSLLRKRLGDRAATVMQ